MKSWFAKYRISAARDAGNDLPASWRRKIECSPQLRDFEEEMAALDGALKASAPEPHAPPSLHSSVMRAVRAAEGPVIPTRRLGFLRWLPAPVVAALALALVWHALRTPVQPTVRSTQALAAATAALEMSGQLPQSVPSAVVSPLSDELQKVHQDLTNTARFLMASVP